MGAVNGLAGNQCGHSFGHNRFIISLLYGPGPDPKEEKPPQNSQDRRFFIENNTLTHLIHPSSKV